MGRPKYHRDVPVPKTDEEIVEAIVKKDVRQEADNWDIGDGYLELIERGWTQQNIADACNTKQQRVSRYLACVRLYSLGSKRPSFWEAYQEIRSDKDETNWVDKECKAVEWYTPEEILERVRDYFGGVIPLDPATVPDNPTGAERFFTAKQNGLSQSWGGSGAFVNPPYGKTISEWCAKIHEEAGSGLPIIALLPCGARFSTEYWQEHILSGELTAVCFVRGRVGFVSEGGDKQAGNPYDSAIYGFNADPTKFAAAFGVLGKVFRMESA